jgi:PAS domain S-box-containing protein
MKSLIWISGLLLFLGATCAAFIVLPPPGAAWRERLQEGGAAPERREVLAELGEQARQVAAGVEDLLAKELEAVEHAVLRLPAERLERMLKEWELHPPSRRELRGRIREELHGLKESASLERLLLVTLDGEVLAGGREEQDVGEEHGDSRSHGLARAAAACEPIFRGGMAGASIEALGAESCSRSASESAGEPCLFLAAGKAIWTRPDCPHAVLLGCRGFEGVAERIERLVAEAGRSRLEWHLLAVSGREAPVLIAGPRAGTSVRAALVRELLADSSSEEAAFPRVGPQVGGWRALRSQAGELAGGWGVTVAPEVVAAALAPRITLPKLPAIFKVPGLFDALLVAGIVLAGVVVLWIFLSVWQLLASGRRRAAPAGRSTSPRREKLPPSRGSGREELAAEIDADLSRKLAMLASLPGELACSMREQIAALGETLAGFAGELAGLDQRLVGLEQAFREFSERLETQRGEERLELAREWQERVGALFQKMEEPRAEGEELAAGLAGGRRVEESLRSQLEGGDAAPSALEAEVERLSKALEAAGEEGRALAGANARLAEEVSCLRQAALEVTTDERLRELAEEVVRLREELASRLPESPPIAEPARWSEGAVREARPREELVRGFGSRVRLDERAGRGVEELEAEELLDELTQLRSFQAALLEGSLPAPLAAVDSRLLVFAWNPAAEAFWGLPAEEALGRRLDERRLGAPELEEVLAPAVRRVLSRKEAEILPGIGRRQGEACGSRGAILCEPILAPEGEALGAIIWVDERAAAGEANLESGFLEKFEESLAMSLPMALVVTDCQGRVMCWNRTAAELLEVSEEEALGRDFLSLRTSIAGASAQERLAAALESGEPQRFLLGRERDGGEPLEYLVTVSPFRSPQGRVHGNLLLMEEVVEEMAAH